MDMKKWLQEMLESPTKKAMPILSFPSASLLGMSVAELLSTAENQAAGIAAVAQHTNAAAAVSMMDLSIEAEAFGSTIKASDHEVPTIVGHIVETEEDADALVIPAVGAALFFDFDEAFEGYIKIPYSALKNDSGLIFSNEKDILNKNDLTFL